MSRLAGAVFVALFSTAWAAGAAVAQDEPVPPPPAPAPPPPAADAVPPPPAAYGGGGAVPPPPGAQVPPPGAPAVAAPPTGAYLHDGFQLRMALGVGGIGAQRTTQAEDVTGEFESEVEGGGLGIELTFAGTPASGLVIGGMWLIQSIGEATIVPADGGDETQLDGFVISLMAAVLDWYPWPDGGFHFGGGLGWLLASGSLPSDAPATTEFGIEKIGGSGWGLTLQVGYDFWIAEQWSMGPLLRFVFGGVHGETRIEPGDRLVEEDDGITALLLSFSASLH